MPDEATEKIISRTFSLPTSLYDDVAREAAARDISASQLVRQAIRLYFRVEGTKCPPTDPTVSAQR